MTDKEKDMAEQLIASGRQLDSEQTLALTELVMNDTELTSHQSKWLLKLFEKNFGRITND